jgi:antirestriction protein ArdC
MEGLNMTSKEIYADVTKRITEALESGTIPWRKPWAGGPDGIGAACNLVTRKPYRGINALLLGIMPYESPYYLTAKQVEKLGGTLKAGAKPVPIIFWSLFAKETGDTRPDGLPETEHIPFMRYYSVYNAQEHCTGLNIPAMPQAPIVGNFNPITEAERILHGFADCPEITHGQAAAYYRPSSDVINMPKPALFA